MPAPKELAICHVIKGGQVLLVKPEQGLSKGKWNAPLGEIVQGEKPNKSAMKYVFQQTGLYVSKTVYHGTIRLFLNGQVEYTYRLHVFSTKLFSGDLKPNIEGEARWFNFADIPYYEMWPDDKYWIEYVLQGKQFEADFFLDEKNEKVVKYQIREKKEVLSKIIPFIVIFAVLAVLAVGIFSSGILNQKAGPSTTSTVKNSIVLKPTVTTTPTTTTIAPPVTQIPTSTGSPSNGTSYIYYITYAGNPATTQTYYSVANSSGITNWKLLAGNPVGIKTASCNVYQNYIYCTGSSQAAPNVTIASNTPAPAANVIRIANPECLALKPPNPDICYNTYTT